VQKASYKRDEEKRAVWFSQSACVLFAGLFGRDATFLHQRLDDDVRQFEDTQIRMALQCHHRFAVHEAFVCSSIALGEPVALISKLEDLVAVALKQANVAQHASGVINRMREEALGMLRGRKLGETVVAHAEVLNFGDECVAGVGTNAAGEGTSEKLASKA